MMLFLFATKVFSSFSCHAEHCTKCNYNNYCSECEEGYGLTDTECGLCHETCKKCEKPQFPAQCTECFDGFYLLKTYPYNSFGSCKACSSDGLCAKCNQYSPYACTECQINSYLDKTSSPATCKKCYASCATCSGPEENQCLTCMDGFYLTDDNHCKPCGQDCQKCENNTKCDTCNDHFYLDSTFTCQKCDDSCKSCHAGTINDCDECYDGFYDSNGLCRACDPNCKTCKGSRNLCTTCEDGKYLDKEKLFCQDCDPSCSTCNNADSCESCKDGFYRKSSNDKCLPCSEGAENCINCVYNNNKKEVLCTSCMLGYYPSSISGVTGAFYCKKSTYEGCLNATAMYSCASCIDGYYLSSTSCRRCEKSCQTCTNASVCTSCPVGSYLNDVSLCDKCLPNCDECENSSVCNKCLDGYFLSNGVCKPCDESCQTCKDDTNACIKCATGYYFNQFKRCIKCGDHCDKCQDSTHCLDCETEYFVAPDGLCYPCADVCFECTGPTAADCIECDPGYYLSSSLKKCFKCHEACQVCDGPNDYECSECSPGYFFNGKQCIKCEYGCKNCTSTIKCVECNEGFYLSREDCLHCKDGCKSCKNGVDKCTECLDGFYESSRDGDLVNCSICPLDCEMCSLSESGDILCNSCYDGYYLKNKVCERCSSPCQTCTSEKVCKSCIKGHLLGNDSSCNSLCSSSCATCENDANSCTSCHDGFILNGTVCLQCPENCKSCDINGDASICTSCLDGFYLENAECLACSPNCATCANNKESSCYTCPDGYYKSNQDNEYKGTCRLCSYYTKNCSRCTSNCASSSYCSFQCLDCDDGFYLSGNSCNACHKTCKTCDGSSEQNCLECTDKFFLQDGKCVGCDSSCQTCEGSPSNCTSCKEHQYLENGKCNECSDSCVECLDANTCTKCPDYQFMHEGKCLKSCLQLGEGWGGNTKFECEKCNLEHCKNYDDGCQCTLCDEGYYIVSDPITLIEICIPCQLDNCKACNGPEKNDCTACNTGYNLHVDEINGEKTCVSVCGEGYFVNQSNKCEKCSSPCKICSGVDGSICSQCEEGYFSNGTTCSFLPAGCEYLKHCENENKGEKPVQVIIETTKFDSYKSEKGGGALRLVNCELSCETANFNECISTKGGGGAIYISNEKEQDYTITLKGLTFTSCKAAYGGAIFAYSIAEQSPVIIESCNFIDNDVYTHKTNDTENEFVGGSALYLVVKNGSVNTCSFVNHDKLSASFVKVSYNFNSHPDRLKMLQEINNEESESVIFSDCSFQDNEVSSKIYVIEKQTSKFDANVYVSDGKKGKNAKLNSIDNEMMGELNNKFIVFDSENRISTEKKEFVVKMSLTSKLLMIISSFGFVVLIISIIYRKKIDEQDHEMTNISVDTLDE